ncbi:phage/plasmid primase, P4 family [Tissierellaceae bacterium HCP3S3_D8]
MFKGYIPTKGKRPTESIKGRTSFYPLDEVKHLQSYGGVLKDNVIMIDSDDGEESEILHRIVQDLKINCNILKTTRGKHFYFKNTNIKSNKIGNQCPLSLTLDYKLGTKNTVVPLKINGTERKWLQETDTIDPLPIWLIPIGKNIINFQELGEGDGRNQALFNYILKLQSEGLTKDAIRETITIINTHILEDPLPERELETILRDESFQKPVFFKGNQLLHDKFAEYLKHEENIIKTNGILHIYKNGIYTFDQVEIEKSMIKHISILKRSQRNEILSYLELIAEEKELSDVNNIVLENGLYNIKTDKLTDYDPNYIAKNKIPVNYNHEAYSKSMDKTLNKIACNDKQLRMLLEEMIGYTLLRRNELGKSFILIGQGSNGKSTLLDVIKHFLGDDNISSISLEELGQRFKTAELYGKLANIGDDISSRYMEDNAIFKKLVTGETVNVERKGKDPFDFNNYGKLIFSANEMPRINDTSDGLMRRLVIVPFNAKFSSKDPDFDPFIKDKLLTDESMEYLLNISIEGLKRVIKNNRFTEVSSVEEEIKEYEKRNNPVVAFLDENDIEEETVEETYLKYSTWCIENGLRALSKNMFGREVKKQGFNSDSTIRDDRGKQKRIYMRN